MWEYCSTTQGTNHAGDNNGGTIAILKIFVGNFNNAVMLNLINTMVGSPSVTGCLDLDVGELSAFVVFTLTPDRIYGPLPESVYDLKNLRFSTATLSSWDDGQ